ncbi:hypothetical protein I302_103220 [Kwoniella bestiolae CBS 10118]|uniref:DH domain-containing protein n=1 Tax=Kwoniella bestiolae CBS 10118 TaxID=1296100 RepID=A0A1B9G7S3_9TREE|nr:hypothetical protein I302_01919 [Kwoniella bestiolae CBS 10118]OCF27084.1 hypothetical protein I302_01919 [Kwoniella bestiolae CBS 10118]
MDPLIIVHPSTLAILTLEPIPQSEAPTPSQRESPPNEAGPSGSAPTLDQEQPLPSPSDFAGSSRRSSVSSYYPIPGSYFPAAGTSRRTYATSSGTNTPSERPRPSPINIPAATPDEPLFSAYPDTGSSKPDIKGKGRALNLPLGPALDLSSGTISRRRRNEEAEESSADEWKMPVASSTRHPQPHHHLRQTHHHHHSQQHSHSYRNSPARPRSPARDRHTRKRAATISSSTEMEGIGHVKSASPSAAEDQRQTQASSKSALRLSSVPGPKSLGGFRRRRASVGTVSAPIEVEFEPAGSTNQWKNMPEEVAQKFDSPPIPFSYQQPTRSDYTLQSISTAATVRPIGSPSGGETGADMIPVIAPRRSSLSGLDPPILLGLTNISRPLPEGNIELIIPEDMVMPHNPPPRRSSLEYDEAVVVEIKSKVDPEISASASAIIVDDHEQSVLSASLTNTDTSTSASAAAFSPSTSSKEHPLSSATTSLSRSAKSGKEGEQEDKKEASLSAVRLQRSLEWEAKQNRLKRKLEKRIMIILELAETEVAYTEDLRTLCHVYLPQLAALPSVNERNAKMIARNTEELLVFHAAFAGKMVETLKEEGLGYHSPRELEVGSAGQVDRVSRKLAALFVDDITQFSLYKDFCAESIIATTLVKHISERVDYEGFEKRCQIIGAAQPFFTLRDLLDDSNPSKTAHRSRLHFKDYLITPIQRICRYPLLLGQLLDAAGTTSPDSRSEHSDEGFDVGVDLERALGAMRGVAEEADEARRLKDAEVKSATVLDRLEPHPNLTPTFIKSLGTCRLIGSLDVLHHHPTLAPLVPPVKVKYLAAFLYRGYLILAKVKKGKAYEAKHFLPLEVFELIDITEGFLPHSIRLTLREHNFDLAASCEAEKEVWSAAICQARDESVIPPFELPASVSPFPVRARRSSTAFSGDFDVYATPHTVPKRHTLVGAPAELDEFSSRAATPSTKPVNTAGSKPSTPLISPIKSTFGFTPERKSSHNATILLRRASNSQRMLVERGLNDLFSDICSTIRSKAQLQHHTLFLPDVPSFPHSENGHGDGMSTKESTMLRRRKSFLDHRARRESIDIAITGEIKGSVIELRPSRSHGGRFRTLPSSTSRRRAGSISSTTRGNNDNEEGDDESASVTATAISDFGTLGRTAGNIAYSRNNSVSSLQSYGSPMITPRRSLSSLRGLSSVSQPGGIEEETLMIKSKDRQRHHSQPPQAPRSKSYKMETPNRKNKQNLSLSSMPYSFRARSTPVSPILSPTHEIPPVPKMPPLIQKSKSDESPRKFSQLPQSSTKARGSNDSESTSQSGSASASASALGTGVMEYFIPPPHGLALDSIGSSGAFPTSSSGTGGFGSTSKVGTVDPDKPLATTWGTLRRSMSFLPLRRGNSITSMADEFGGGGGMEHSNSNSNSNSSGTTSAEGSEESHGYLSNEKTSTTNEDPAGEEREMGTRGWRSAPNTPKRKKSLRLFGLKGFTPM